MPEPVYVVLGVHRGGTSVAARALAALGISLGDNLMPPSAGNNERGFWEDLDIVKLNEDVLAALGERWDSVRIYDESNTERSLFDSLVDRGALLLKEKSARFLPFGFKDPRTTRLLFYWRAVFALAGLDPHYVIITRDPLSVAESLAKRDLFPPEKSFVVWLVHLLSALHGTEGQKRIVVDYDRVVAAPRPELERICAAFGLNWNAEQIGEFESEFLSSDLQHHKFGRDDVMQQASMPELARQLFALLERLSADQLDANSGELHETIASIWRYYIELVPAFVFAERVGDEVHKRDQTILDRDRELGEYAKVVENRDGRIEELVAVVRERDRAIASRDRQIKVRDNEIVALTKAATARIDSVGRQLHAARWRLASIEQSSFWRWTIPLRAVWHFVEKKLFRRNYSFELFPNGDLTFVGERFDWGAIANDPHFTMVPVGSSYPSRWVVLETSVEGVAEGQPVKLYYDAGEGMTEETAITLRVRERGHVKDVIWLPHGVVQLRWDPRQSPGPLTQHPISMSRAGLIERSMLRVARIHEALNKHDSSRLKQAKVSWLDFLLRPQRTYEAAGNLAALRADTGYQDWADANKLSDVDRHAIAAHIARFTLRPLISVVMPVYNTPRDALLDAINSVRAQLYPHWELCIADDASTAPHIREMLENFRSQDSRIKVGYRTVNGHISAASNTALGMAQGEFVALVDHDDVLSEQALYQVAAWLNQHPESDIIYTDEDKIVHEEGTDVVSCREPHFKSDWNPDLLYSQNYVSHLGIYRTSLIKAVGGFREGFEGSQDYDLLLRCVAATDKSRISHIPAVLYHWRASAGSTALSSEEKNYATASGIRALQDHFHEKGLRGLSVEQGRFPTTYRVRFPIPEPAPKVSLLIPTRDQHKILRLCLDSIRSKTTYDNYEIVIIDNQSSEKDAVDYLEDLEAQGVRVLRYDRPFNYSAINNFAVEHVDGEVVGLLNNDVEVISPGWLTEMVSHALRPDVGAVGAKLYYSNDTIQHAGVIVGLGGVAGHSHKHLPRETPGYFRRLFLTQNLSAVTGACLVVRRENYRKVHGLNSENLPIAFNDVDFCLKLCEIGLRNVWTPYAELYHHESLSRGPEDSPEKTRRFKAEMNYMQTRWGERLRKDPYYSPMLTLDRENFQPDFRQSPPKPWLQR